MNITSEEIVYRPEGCGTCTMCCKLPRILEPDLNKPENTWCTHCAIGSGCKQYEARPESCSSYFCLWLITPNLPPELRPDKTKTIITTTVVGDAILLQMAPENWDYWKRKPMSTYVKQWLVNSHRPIMLTDGIRNEAIRMERDGKTYSRWKGTFLGIKDEGLQTETRMMEFSTRIGLYPLNEL